MEFREKLVEVRKSSRWPDQDDFSAHGGVSLGGYKKWERGERLPDKDTLLEMMRRLNLDLTVKGDLLTLWQRAQAKKAGIEPVTAESKIDSEAVAKRIQNEVSYVLKQARIAVPESTKRVMENRISIILKSSLGE